VTMHALGTAIAPVGAEAAASSTRVAVDFSSDRRKDHVLGGTR